MSKAQLDLGGPLRNPRRRDTAIESDQPNVNDINVGRDLPHRLQLRHFFRHLSIHGLSRQFQKALVSNICGVLHLSQLKMWPSQLGPTSLTLHHKGRHFNSNKIQPLDRIAAGPGECRQGPQRHVAPARQRLGNVRLRFTKRLGEVGFRNPFLLHQTEDLLRSQEDGSLFLKELTLTGGGMLLFKPSLSHESSPFSQTRP